MCLYLESFFYKKSNFFDKKQCFTVSKLKNFSVRIHLPYLPCAYKRFKTILLTFFTLKQFHQLDTNDRLHFKTSTLQTKNTYSVHLISKTQNSPKF